MAERFRIASWLTRVHATQHLESAFSGGCAFRCTLTADREGPGESTTDVIRILRKRNVVRDRPHSPVSWPINKNVPLVAYLAQWGINWLFSPGR
jgi:hypothetical protein